MTSNSLILQSQPEIHFCYGSAFRDGHLNEEEQTCDQFKSGKAFTVPVTHYSEMTQGVYGINISEGELLPDSFTLKVEALKKKMGVEELLEE